jgi:hypothetical protein
MLPAGQPRPLPIRPRPHPADTVDSYIEALAEANHLKPGHLRAYICRSRENRSHPLRPRLERLAVLSGRTVDVLRQALADLRCAYCDTPLPLPATPARAKRWCSRACQQAAYRQRQNDPGDAGSSGSTSAAAPQCEQCRALASGNRAVRWCSPACRRARQRERRHPSLPKNCERCGTPLTPARTRHSRRWCSPTCRWAFHNQQRKANIRRSASDQ